MKYAQHKRCNCGHTRATHNYTGPNKKSGDPGGYRRCGGDDWNCECKEYDPAVKLPVGLARGYDGCPR